MSELERELARFRRDLRARERSAVRRLVHAYREVEARLVVELDASDAVRRKHLLDQVRAELDRYAEATLRPVVQQGLIDAVALGEIHAERAVSLSLGQLVYPYARLNVGAIEHLVGATTRGPLARLLATFGPTGSERARQALILSATLGENPKLTARRLRKVIRINRNRAVLISRTETFRAYREATRLSYQANSAVVQSWQWLSAADARTCAACWALHGREFSLNEPMRAHPACRCTMIPKTKTYHDLGISQDEPFVLEPGETLFAKQSQALQRQVLGPKAFDAYTTKLITINDLLVVKRNPQWGATYQRGSVRSVLYGTS